MKIIIEKQQLHVENIDVVAVSSSSTLQVGDNDQVVLFSAIDSPPDSIVIGDFPRETKKTSKKGKYIVPLPNTVSNKGTI